MRRIWFLVLSMCCAVAMDAAAQGTPSTRRPAPDSIRMADPAQEPAADADEEDADEDAAADTVPPRTGPYARAGGRGPFTVQASGQPAPRPHRGDVVWVAPGPAARAAARDTARTGERVAANPPARRDTASTSRPAARDTVRTGERVAANPPARRDTASASRPATRDTARTGERVAATPPARRDTASTSRRTAPRDTVRIGSAGRTGSTAPRDTIRSTPSAGGQAGRTGTTAATSRPRTHTVAAGETFYGIARRYGVSAAQLRALNPDVNVDVLEVGDELRLPAGARDSRAGTPPRTETQPSGRTQPQPPARGSRTHTVAAGETLFGIARRYGVTADAIRRANQMETDQVRTGQRLVIPPAN